MVNYFRLTADRRLLFGGGESYGWRFPADIAGVVRPRMLGVFPELARRRRSTHAWGGHAGDHRQPDAGLPAAGGRASSPPPAIPGTGVAMATLAGKLMAEAVRGTAERFDVFAALPQPALPRRRRAALAASGAGDELVRAARPALKCRSGSPSRWRRLPAEPADRAAEGADAARRRDRRGLRALPLRRALGAVLLVRGRWRRAGCGAAATLPFALWALAGAVVADRGDAALAAASSPAATSRSATPSPRPRRCRRRCSGWC